MNPCGDVKLPGVTRIMGHDGDGKVIVRWKGDSESDYRVERPYALLCLVLITRLGYRVAEPDSEFTLDDLTPDDAA